MIATEVLAELRHRGVELFVADGVLRYRAPRGVLTPELLATLSAHKAELLAMLAAPAFDLDAGDLVAFKLVNTSIGDVWVVADDDTLVDHPDIIRAGLPVFYFDELEQLRGKTPAELKAIGLVKGTFPSSRVLQ